MNILLVGGGSGGPVMPLLATAEAIKKTHPRARFLLVGTRSGPESNIAQKAGLDFAAISAGKLRRYLSWRNLLAPFQVGAGFWQARRILREFKPDCILAAGGFVQVPLVWAAYFMGIPVVLHQQDVLPSLANRLCQLAASKITVTFEGGQAAFASGLGLFYNRKRDKIIWTGNPFRQQLADGDKERAGKFFGLKPDLPTLLVLGGGSGAQFLNRLIGDSLPDLSRSVQIIHATGAGKGGGAMPADNYHPYEFIDNMADAYAAADLVLCRAGLSTITELSNLQKISIIVPMPDSHQEINGLLLYRLDAAIVLQQHLLNPARLVELVRKLLFDAEAQKILQRNIGLIMPRRAAEKVADLVVKLAEHKNGTN